MAATFHEHQLEMRTKVVNPATLEAHGQVMTTNGIVAKPKYA
jgi:hypothetical protein